MRVQDSFIKLKIKKKYMQGTLDELKFEPSITGRIFSQAQHLNYNV
jgi:hypothetical protein